MVSQGEGRVREWGGECVRVSESNCRDTTEAGGFYRQTVNTELCESVCQCSPVPTHRREHHTSTRVKCNHPQISKVASLTQQVICMRRGHSLPLYANRSVKLKEDVVSGGGGDGPEEVLSQVGLLQGVALVYLEHTSHTIAF